MNIIIDIRNTGSTGLHQFGWKSFYTITLDCGCKVQEWTGKDRTSPLPPWKIGDEYRHDNHAYNEPLYEQGFNKKYFPRVKDAIAWKNGHAPEFLGCGSISRVFSEK